MVDDEGLQVLQVLAGRKWRRERRGANKGQVAVAYELTACGPASSSEKSFLFLSLFPTRPSLSIFGKGRCLSFDVLLRKKGFT